MRTSWIVLGVVAISGVFMYRHFHHSGAEQMAGMAPGGAVPVSVAVVPERDVQVWKEFSGRFVAVDQAEIRPRVAGNIDAIHFIEGAMVKKGDLLFTIDPRPFEAEMRQAEAQATFTKADYERAVPLLRENNIAKRTFDERATAARVAAAALKTAQLNLEYTRITAPISGKVGRAELTVGNLVQTVPNAPLLTTIVSNTPIYVDFEMDEQSFLSYTHQNATAGVQVSNIPVSVGLAGEKDVAHVGKLKSFDNKLDASTGTIRARAEIANENGLLVPGLFARVRIGSPAPLHTALVNERAVSTDQNKKFVYVVNKENKVEYRPVVIGPTADGMRVVEGVKAGERIVVNGLQRVRPGAVVQPQEVPMETGEAPAAPAAGAPAAAK